MIGLNRGGRYSAVQYIVFITAAIALAQMIGFGGFLIQWFSLPPSRLLYGEVWRLISYAFLHSMHSPFHLIFNMLALWFLGPEIEYLWGTKRFVYFYLFSALFSGLLSFINIPLGTGHIPIIGASGAIYSLLFVYAHYYPDRVIYIFGVLPLKMRTAVALFALISVLGMMGQGGGIAHVVHLGGFAAGWLWLQGAGDLLSKFKRKKKGRIYKFPTSERKPSVDEILRKISYSGMSSLTSEERKILEEAAGKQ